MNELARPMPRPTAQVADYVDVLGADLAVQFLLRQGGAEMYMPADPKGKSALQDLLGYDKLKELAARPRVAHAACRWPSNGLPPCWTGKAIPRQKSPALCACLTWRCGVGCGPKRRPKDRDDGRPGRQNQKCRAKMCWVAGPSIRLPGNPTLRSDLAPVLRQEDYHRVTPKAVIAHAAR